MEILNGISLKEIMKYKTKIDGVINEFKYLLMYATDDVILDDMKIFLNGKKNYDFQIMDILARNEHGENSILKNFIDVAKKMTERTNNPLQFSVASYVYHFQIEVLYSAMKYVAVLELATAIRDKREDKTFNSDIWTKRKNDLVEQFKTSTIQASKYTSDTQSLSSLLNLTHDKIVSHKFQTVFQTYLINEYEASGKTSCTQQCKYSVNQFIQDGACRGYIGDCYQDDGFGWVKFTKHYVFSPPQTHIQKGSKDFVAYHPESERIYYWYNRFGEKNGIEADSNREKSELTEYFKFGWFSTCEFCKCTCDQTQSSVTVRKIYAGAVKAPSDK
jgi:hypothetical protein